MLYFQLLLLFTSIQFSFFYIAQIQYLDFKYPCKTDVMKRTEEKNNNC